MVNINLIPCIPFPLPRGRGRNFEKRGLNPLLNTPLFYRMESIREAKPLLYYHFLSLDKGEGKRG